MGGVVAHGFPIEPAVLEPFVFLNVCCAILQVAESLAWHAQNQDKIAPLSRKTGLKSNPKTTGLGQNKNVVIFNMSAGNTCKNVLKYLTEYRENCAEANIEDYITWYAEE